MGRWVTRVSHIAAWSVLAMILGGCGPITSTATIHDADIAIEAARVEQAELYAVYEFVSATEYLKKAREEWGSSDWQHAEEYAQRAYDLAVAALQRALAGSQEAAPGTNRRGSTRN